MVDENRVQGAWDKVKGAVKEGAGKLTGDEKLEAEGKADKVQDWLTGKATATQWPGLAPQSALSRRTARSVVARSPPPPYAASPTILRHCWFA